MTRALIDSLRAAFEQTPDGMRVTNAVTHWRDEQQASDQLNASLRTTDLFRTEEEKFGRWSDDPVRTVFSDRRTPSFTKLREPGHEELDKRGRAT
ncbi:MAG: hypothetical protein DI536_24030, partial [Archangium gephyra]